MVELYNKVQYKQWCEADTYHFNWIIRDTYPDGDVLYQGNKCNPSHDELVDLAKHDCKYLHLTVEGYSYGEGHDTHPKSIFTCEAEEDECDEFDNGYNFHFSTILLNNVESLRAIIGYIIQTSNAIPMKGF